MLWCHNSLSGSLAWQPFVMRPPPPKVGWEKRGSSSVVPFILLLFHHVCYTHTHACVPVYMPSKHQPPHRAWGSREGEGHKVDMAAPPCTQRAPGTSLGSQESKWHVEMRTRRWKMWSQRPPDMHLVWHLGEGWVAWCWYIPWRFVHLLAFCLEGSHRFPRDLTSSSL